MKTARFEHPSEADLERLVEAGRSHPDVVDVTDALALPRSSRTLRDRYALSGVHVVRVVRARLEALRLDPSNLSVERVVLRVELALRGDGDRVATDTQVYRGAASNATYRRGLAELARGPLAGAVDDPAVIDRVLSGVGSPSGLRIALRVFAALGESGASIDEVVTALTALADGAPAEWVLRRGDAPVVAR